MNNDWLTSLWKRSVRVAASAGVYAPGAPAATLEEACLRTEGEGRMGEGGCGAPMEAMWRRSGGVSGEPWPWLRVSGEP